MLQSSVASAVRRSSIALVIQHAVRQTGETGVQDENLSDKLAVKDILRLVLALQRQIAKRIMRCIAAIRREDESDQIVAAQFLRLRRGRARLGVTRVGVICRECFSIGIFTFGLLFRSRLVAPEQRFGAALKPLDDAIGLGLQLFALVRRGRLEELFDFLLLDRGSRPARDTLRVPANKRAR